MRTLGRVAHYIFNVVAGDVPAPTLCERAARMLRLHMWGVDAAEKHHDALSPGDLVLIYAGAPARAFVGRAKLASAVQPWTPPEAQALPDRSSRGVLLAEIEEWVPPVPMGAVLSRIDRSAGARADFDAGVVRITASEYETAVAIATGRDPSTR